MEIQYKKWFELRIFHQYYNDGKIPISLVPTQESTIIMQKNKILISKSEGLFEFYIGLDSVNLDHASLIQNIEDIEFKIIIDHHSFFYYTDLSTKNSEEYFLFRNIVSTPDLIKEKYSSETLVEQLEENVIGMLQINVKNLQTDYLTLSFEARKVFFEYQVIIPTHHNWEIIDLKVLGYQNEKYYGPIEKLIDGVQKAHVFISTETLPLSQDYPVPAELILQYKHGSSDIKELNMQLPNASFNNLHYNDDDQPVYSAIIYV
ncbi:hypothetical protein [Cochleicola gelatinilyticus]|uniref:Uncharacterized protein n=1 Tax=Cochleicola gelatinilyticus TaxID=1763537 RepID=A0A167K6C9_9FLAO|nr:hypothetical protein [Cochleicola gelatinilyticus]OAB81433.1 hypothetical protein ULVI_01015 [Cochleicola gelatinilyticus]